MPAIDSDMLVRGIAAQQEQALQPAVPLNGHYPIMLVHGMAGFKPIATMLDYFYQVRSTMQVAGYKVFTSQTDPFQGVAYRAHQLAVQVDEVLALTGASKVHIVAHSQGGLDARYLISTMGYGDRVDTLTTFSSPHHGVKLVDMALQISPAWVDRVARIVNALSNSVLGGNANLMAQLHDVGHTYVTDTFNPANPDDPRVSYYSYAGSTQANPWVDHSRVDLVTPMLLPTYGLLYRVEGDNDGVVPVQSAMWGTYLGTVPADHWDEIGQLPNTPHLAFKHLPFYSALAHFLDTGGAPPIY